MDISNELNLISEYNMWVSARKLAPTNTTPEEFMRDRVKEVALDRVEQALKYLTIDSKEQLDYSTVLSTVTAILEGTYVEPVSGEGVEDIGYEPIPLE